MSGKDVLSVESNTTIGLRCFGGVVDFNTQTFIKELIRSRCSKQSNESGGNPFPARGAEFVYVTFEKLL